MGDRCWLRVDLHGEINDPRIIVQVAKAIVDEWLIDDMVGGNEWKDVATYILTAAAEGENPTFLGNEVNYASIDGLEATLQKLSVAYHAYYGAGGDYGPGCFSWRPERRRLDAQCDHDGDLVVTVDALRKCQKEGNFEEYLERAEQADGSDLPDFELGGLAERMALKLAAAKALKIKAA